MKLYWTILTLLALVTGIGMGSVIAQNQPRFEHVYTSPWIDYIIGGNIFRSKAFIVFHDRETGQEIVCVDGSAYAAESCYLTGRKWK